jgi:AmmeMemoRadiSam system protein B
MLRNPAVAGSFYPADSTALSDALGGMTHDYPHPVRALGMMAPHAGYVYSGHIAGDVYSHVDLPNRTIILGPNHTGRGKPLAIMSDGQWQTPLGQATIDSDLANTLLAMDTGLEDDLEAHQMEHAIEVQLPFLQFLGNQDMRFVPIVVGTTDIEGLTRLGRAIGRVVAESDERVLIIASSDMNHYESDRVTRIKDNKAIERVLDRNPQALHDVVTDEDISMCGFAPTIVMLTAVNLLGARQAELVQYGTSGDIYGDRDRVVGYAGIVIS